MKIERYVLPFLMGCFLYALIEIAVRGYTHWTMVITGGAVLMMLSVLFEDPPALPLPLLLLCGALTVTAIELAVGVQVNLRLHWNVWDYSSRPGNWMGQVCPLYSLFWYFLCIPARFLCRKMAVHFGYAERPSA